MFQPEQQIGIYTLIRRIGRGGFGEVWLAERRTKFVTLEVAVKLPHNDQIDYRVIEQEAKIWKQATGHPNILPINDANEYDGQIVIASEYAPDGSLEKLLNENCGQLPLRQAVELTIGILSGLEFLHSKDIIHRDIKPANILLQGTMPRLADFGISRLTQSTKKTTLTNPGSSAYMSPEAFRRERHKQADIWAVGVILYQMLAGNLPFQGDSPEEVMHAVINDEPKPLPESFPGALRRVVSKALAKKTYERFQTAREMREDLNHISFSLLKSPLPPTEDSVNVKAVKPEPTLKDIFPPKPTQFKLVNENVTTPEVKAQQTQDFPAHSPKVEDKCEMPKNESESSANFFSIRFLKSLFATFILIERLLIPLWIPQLIINNLGEFEFVRFVSGKLLYLLGNERRYNALMGLLIILSTVICFISWKKIHIWIGKTNDNLNELIELTKEIGGVGGFIIGVVILGVITLLIVNLLIAPLVNYFSQIDVSSFAESSYFLIIVLIEYVLIMSIAMKDISSTETQ